MPLLLFRQVSNPTKRTVNSLHESLHRFYAAQQSTMDTLIRDVQDVVERDLQEKYEHQIRGLQTELKLSQQELSTTRIQLQDCCRLVDQLEERLDGQVSEHQKQINLNNTLQLQMDMLRQEYERKLARLEEQHTQDEANLAVVNKKLANIAAIFAHS